MLRDRAYAAADPNSLARRRDLLPGLNDYNCTRQHGSLGKKTPMALLDLLSNLAGNHI